MARWIPGKVGIAVILNDGSVFAAGDAVGNSRPNSMALESFAQRMNWSIFAPRG